MPKSALRRGFYRRLCTKQQEVLRAGDVITPEDVFEVLEEDVKAADLILWVGISFEQSASTAYFRRVRAYLQARVSRLFRPDRALNQQEEPVYAQQPAERHRSYVAFGVLLIMPCP